MTHTLEEQLACVEREVRLRKRVYPRLVAQGKMDQYQAARELRTMQDVLQTLQGLLPQYDLFASRAVPDI